MITLFKKYVTTKAIEAAVEVHFQRTPADASVRISNNVRALGFSKKQNTIGACRILMTTINEPWRSLTSRSNRRGLNILHNVFTSCAAQLNRYIFK